MSNSLNKQLGDILRKARETKGISVRELARRSKIPASTISDYELGKTSISMDKFLELCNNYDLNPSEVLKKIKYR